MKILIADDDPVTRRLLQVSLEKWQYEVIVASDGAQAWAVLSRNENVPNLAILDWMMPGMDGVEICRELRKRGAESYIYTILLTSRSEKDDLLKGLEAGADDYLIKPFDLQELQARLRTGRRIIELQNELIAARESLREQATHDSLTGVWNRAAIMDIFHRELIRARRQGTPLSLLMADFDHFKRINDTLGHLAGDAVLREAAQRMRSVLRPYDAVGRYGGEEFMILAPGCDKIPAMRLAERIRTAVSGRPILVPEGPVSVTMSLGVATTSMSNDASPEAMFRAADAALYCAKQEGRNRVGAAPDVG